MFNLFDIINGHMGLVATTQLPKLPLSPLTSKAQSGDFDFWAGSVVIASLVILLVAIIIAASFWASDDDERLKRQRSYARVDDLYFPVQGIVITKELLAELRSISDSPERLDRYLDTFLTSELRVTSLSLGGCGIKTERPLEKGEYIIIKLAQLPDYPAEQENIVYRVAWVREPKQPDKDNRYTAGLQIVEIIGSQSRESLKKYMSYLLDEPAA